MAGIVYPLKFLNNMFKNPFSPIRVTEKTYNKFVDTGEVPSYIIRMIAFKIIKREPLNIQETAIFNNKTDEINKMIIKITGE
jgi:hypothetical protein